ncbi:MAG: DUF11 domain-containing protein [Kiritimatiellaeota bacterium]|nr:DUF11 domain-containing protein [Kiritimatiellota bacterium]
MADLISRGRKLLPIVSALLVVSMSGCNTGVNKDDDEGAQVGSATRPGYSWRGFPQPVRSPGEAQILVEKEVPTSVRPNKRFIFTITITNKASYGINKVTITEEIPKGFKFIKSMPPPLARETSLKWDLGSIAPGKKERIVVTGMPTRIGTIRYTGETVLNFKVATDSNFASTVNVIEPKLAFDIESPSSALIGDRIAAKLRFKNAGNDTVVGAKLIHTLPKGLLTYSGKSKIEKIIGNLPPGAVKEIPLDLKGIATGDYTAAMMAVAEEGVSASATMSISITKPILTIIGKAPTKRFVGNKSPYTITVANKGDAPAKNLIVKLVLPQGIGLQSANEGGQALGNTVVWRIPSLLPNDSKKVRAMTLCKQIMKARAVASATAKAADRVETAIMTDIGGIAGLLTTLIDVNDPVPVGDDVTYVVTSKNTGSLDSTKVKITCTLAKEMKYIESVGATKGTLDRNKLTFDLLPSINPGSTATWTIKLKAIAPGDVRFQVSVESDQLDRPVELFESTHFYK